MARSYTTRERILALMTPRSFRDIAHISGVPVSYIQSILQLSHEYEPALIAKSYREAGLPMSAKTVRQIIRLHAPYTQKEIAKFLGVSERTVRRWKNQEVLKPSPLSQKKLVQKSTQSREHLLRRAHEEAKRGRVKYKLPRVLPSVQISRQLKKIRDREGRETGEYTVSDWLTLHVEFLTTAEIARLVINFQRQGNYQFVTVYKVPPAGDSPEPRKKPLTSKEKRHSRRVGTRTERLNDFTEADLIAYFDAIMLNNAENYTRKILYVRLLPIRFKHRG